MRCVLLCATLAWSMPELRWQDSSGQWVGLRPALQDSIDAKTLEEHSHLNHLAVFHLGVDGQFLDRLHFASKVRVATEWTDAAVPMHDYQPFHGLPYNPQDSTGWLKRRTWDVFSTTSTLDLGRLKLMAGLDWLKNGPAVRNPLLWSGERNVHRVWNTGSTPLSISAPVLYVGWDLPFQWVRYTQQSGQLKFRKDLDKWFHTHRLEANWGGLSLGGTETVIYGTAYAGDTFDGDAEYKDRGMQWLYAMPFVPYFFAQHYFGDRDNSAITLDAAYSGRWGRVYAELLLDDLKEPQKILSDDWWGNKYGVTAGYSLIIPLAAWNYGWQAEITRIEPWVYTHRFGNGSNMSHYGKPIGSDLGPNALELWSQMYLQSDIYGRFLVEGDLVRKGQDEGSHLWDNSPTQGRTDKTFLAEDSTKTYVQASVGWSGTAFASGLRGALWLDRYDGALEGWGVRTTVTAGW